MNQNLTLKGDYTIQETPPHIKTYAYTYKQLTKQA